MWCPICDIVELERPKLKDVLDEIEDLFNEVINMYN